MNICIPVLDDQGLESPVSPHFGSAPMYLIVNSETRALRCIPNQNASHSHGMCNPLGSLVGQRVDSVVVGGIGKGALRKLQEARISVLLGQAGTVEGLLAALEAGTLQEMVPEMACGGHAHASPPDGKSGCCGH